MNGLRFELGELARIVVADPENVGKIVEIDAVGPFKKGHRLAWNGFHRIAASDCDYFVGGEWIALDWMLQKLDPPAEPESITRREEVEA